MAAQGEASLRDKSDLVAGSLMRELQGALSLIRRCCLSSCFKYLRRRHAPTGAPLTGQDQRTVANFDARPSLKIAHSEQRLVQFALVDPNADIFVSDGTQRNAVEPD